MSNHDLSAIIRRAYERAGMRAESARRMAGELLDAAGVDIRPVETANSAPNTVEPGEEFSEVEAGQSGPPDSSTPVDENPGVISLDEYRRR